MNTKNNQDVEEEELKVFKYTHESPYWHDEYGGFSFIITKPSDDGITLVQSSEAYSCREFFTLYTGARQIRRAASSRIQKAYALVTSGKAKGASGHDVWIDKLKNSIVILNAFESHYTIPKTRIYPVLCESLKSVAFIIGPKRWTASRYSFGLWTLFFRLGMSGTFNSTKSIKELLPGMKWPEMRNRILQASNANLTYSQAKCVFRDIDIFMAFEKKHLKVKDRYDSWNPDYVGSGMERPEGIAKLISGGSYSNHFKKLYLDFKKEYWKNEKDKKS